MKKIANSIAGGSYNNGNMKSTIGKVYYSDIDPNFKIDTRNNDVATVINVESVRNSIVGIISSRKNERPFSPEFGSDVHDSLFENMGDFSAYAIEQAISQAIVTYEPRALVQNIKAVPMDDDNSYNVTVQYHIITDLNHMYSLKLTLKSDL